MELDGIHSPHDAAGWWWKQATTVREVRSHSRRCFGDRKWRERHRNWVGRPWMCRVGRGYRHIADYNDDMVRAERGLCRKVWPTRKEVRSRQPQAVITGLFKEHQTFQRSSETRGSSLNVWMSIGMTGRVCSRRKLLVLKNKRSFRRKPGINKSDIGCRLFFFFWGGRVKYILIFRESMNCSKVWAIDWPGDNSRLL